MTDPMNRRSFLQAATALAAGVAVTSSLARAQETTSTASAAADESGAKARWKKGVKYSMLPRKESPEARLTLAKECGFEGVEIDTREELLDPEGCAKLGELAKKIGIPVHGVVFGGWHAPLSDPDAAVRQKGIDGMKLALRSARAMDVETCLLVPAVVTEKVRYKDAWDRSQAGIRELIPTAEKEKVFICVENVWNMFLLSPLEFARYIDDFENPWVRAYYDTANSIVQGFSEDWIRTLGKRIRKCDVKDFDRKAHKFVDLGKGDVNWPEVKKALDEIGYTDFLTAETGEADRARLIEIRQSMDRVLA